MRRILILLLLVVLTLGCTSETAQVQTTAPPETTQPPVTTTAPQTTAPPTTVPPITVPSQTTLPPTTTAPPTTTPSPTTPPTEPTKLTIAIDGNIDDWNILDAVLVSDQLGDSIATDNLGTDIKSLYVSCDDEYLAFALELDGILDLSKFRNYFIGVDFDGDNDDEYHFGFRSNGDAWVFDHTVDKNNWNDEPAEIEIGTSPADGLIEGKIPRNKYNIPNMISAFARVTEGGPTVDYTSWISVECSKKLEILGEETEITESPLFTITLDGEIDDWSGRYFISDNIGDSIAKETVGTDIKSLHATCNSEYLYFALELDGALDLSKFRNYFLRLDFDWDQDHEYIFGFRPTGQTWIGFEGEPAKVWVASSSANGIIEGKILRNEYNIPDNFQVFARVSEGGPIVDYTGWLGVSCEL